MEMASIASSPRTVEEIYKDYGGRRTGIVRALTYDVDEFYGLCDPEKENLCLYGHPNESWEVTLPAEEVPPELPEPALGINFARDGMHRKDWLSLVAVHSDCWLLSVAFYLGARLNRNERKRLFSLINDLPTVFEVVTERKPVKDKPSADSGSKSRGSTKLSLCCSNLYNPHDWVITCAMPRRVAPLCNINMGSSRSDGSGKDRIKWTQELHDLFEKAVNQLGGPDRATPKGILKIMDIQELTIYHVKSHLQKYRMSKYVPESSSRGNFDRRSISEILPNFSTTSGAQLMEALQLQMEVQRRLGDQLEVQRNLRVKIEAQGRFLERIAEEYKNRPNATKATEPLSPISLQSLCEESEYNAKEFELDSEVDRDEIRSQEEFRVPKRLKVEDNNAFPKRFKCPLLNSSEFCTKKKLLQKGAAIPFLSQENSFPWSIGYYPSPLNASFL